MKTTFRIEDWLGRHGRKVIKILYRNSAQTGNVRVNTILNRDDRTVLKVGSEESALIIKIFRSNDQSAQTASEREAYGLIALNGLELSPKLFAFSRGDAYVIEEFVKGELLSDIATEKNLLDISRKIGIWAAKYITTQPVRTEEIDWYDYLKLYREPQGWDCNHKAHGKMSGQPVKRFALAKNDLHLSNFVQRNDGHLIGFDFEKSRFKPVGWDVLVAARQLSKMFPAEEGAIVDALVEGWQSEPVPDAPVNLSDIALFYVQSWISEKMA